VCIFSSLGRPLVWLSLPSVSYRLLSCCSSHRHWHTWTIETRETLHGIHGARAFWLYQVNTTFPCLAHTTATCSARHTALFASHRWSPSRRIFFVRFRFQRVGQAGRGAPDPGSPTVSRIPPKLPAPSSQLPQLCSSPVPTLNAQRSLNTSSCIRCEPAPNHPFDCSPSGPPRWSLPGSRSETFSPLACGRLY
jgi:hypothetical protein